MDKQYVALRLTREEAIHLIKCAELYPYKPLDEKDAKSVLKKLYDSLLGKKRKRS